MIVIIYFDGRSFLQSDSVWKVEPTTEAFGYNHVQTLFSVTKAHKRNHSESKLFFSPEQKPTGAKPTVYSNWEISLTLII